MAQESPAEFDFTVAEMVMIGRTPHKGAFDRDDEHATGTPWPEAMSGSAASSWPAAGSTRCPAARSSASLIARAIAQGADHLILDEPTNHLDIRYQVEILELVAGLGVTVLAAMHDLSLAALFCDTVHLLAGGRHRGRRHPGRSSPPRRCARPTGPMS